MKDKAYKIHINGTIQGVGFRPLVYNLAKKMGINGFIANTSFGAVLEVNANLKSLNELIKRISKSLPRSAKIINIKISGIKNRNFKDFKIVPSKKDGLITADFPSDLSICSKCLNELKDPKNKRYAYPFINCTNCGPRFTIIKKLPYDRPNTTMSVFKMCEHCRAEYNMPSDRRFHAQPNACELCGPEVKLVSGKFSEIARGKGAIKRTVSLINEGRIIAVKGIGGYHIACDAKNDKTVNALRKRKNRPFKPFAIMAKDITTVRKICDIGTNEIKQLESARRPIVLLRKKTKPKLKLSKKISPNNPRYGVILPYTPIHHLLFSKNTDVLIMTSANRRDEPICSTENDAKKNLSGIADYFLTHNRKINNRCDDSILMPDTKGSKNSVFIRRSRGYVPSSVDMHCQTDKPENLLCLGADLKNTFCITRGDKAYVSQYIGDLDSMTARIYLKDAIEGFKKFLGVNPHHLVCDMHPDYASVNIAKEVCLKSGKLTQVQHHHAHVASVIAEKSLKLPIAGFAFDGLGYGLDGNIWGGECFVFNGSEINRFAHFDYFHLPGGDRAVKEVWRVALSLFKEAGIQPFGRYKKYPYKQISDMIDKNINSPLTSSVGRLFDGVSSILDVRQESVYEAHAAIELENISIDKKTDKVYNVKISNVSNNSEPLVISVKDIVIGVLEDLKKGVSRGIIGRKFHNTLSDIVFRISIIIRKRFGIKSVVLSGGVFQNALLLEITGKKLALAGFKVYNNNIVPPNDGGISLGQAYLALKYKD